MHNRNPRYRIAQLATGVGAVILLLGCSGAANTPVGATKKSNTLPVTKAAGNVPMPTQAMPTIPTKAVSKASQLTKEQFRKQLMDLIERTPGVAGMARYTLVASEVEGLFGKPSRTQTIGERRYWYYTCQDGTMQLVLRNYDDPQNKRIFLFEINDF